MITYCLIFIWSIINSKLVKLKEKNNWLFFILVLLPPVLFATIRYNIGTDYVNYLYYYNTRIYMNTYEPMFRLLNYIAQVVFHGFYGVLLLSAIITYGFMLATLVKLKDEISISIGLWIYYCYYYVASFNVMRQLIAVSIVLFATVSLVEGKQIRFVALIIFASLFHVSAILALVFLLIYKIQTIKKAYWISILYGCSALLIFAGGYILNIMSRFLGDYSMYIYNVSAIVSMKYFLDIIPTFLIIGIPAIIYLRRYRNVETYNVFCVIELFSIAILIMGYHFRWFQRVLYYFDIMQILIVPMIVKKTKLPQNRIIVKGIVVLFYLLYFWYSSVFRGSNGGVPYQSQFFI